MNVVTKKSPDRSGVQVISRAIEVLRSLENLPEGLSLGEIAKAISLPRSTVQRIVATLSNEGFLIAASPNAKVRLGPAILQLASSLDFDITKIMRPFLRDLGADVQETVDLSIHRGGSVVFVDQIIGKRRLVATSATGERFPLHCTANGKAILAALPPDAAKRGLERSLREHGEFPLDDEDALWREIARIRRELVAFDREQHASGISAIGTAIADPCGGFFALSIPVPAARFRRTEAQLVEKLLEHRKRIISNRLRKNPSV
jgi:DNA-binding IclR family transcriptional regulator